VIGYVLDRKHAAIVVPDYNRAGEPTLVKPARRVIVVFNPLPDRARVAGGSPKAGETDLALSERLFV
jgi:hypothetical protein